ncbi:hypothetical protein BBJ28_00000542 [Nothophytophthora sp. Chile5]|nr:hypothetical protein BBJ28_00000542 [Nothophytophthora sp. Chile5]
MATLRGRGLGREAKESFAWEEDFDRPDSRSDFGDRQHSPVRSYRSTSSRRAPSENGSNNSHQYYVGIKEKLATITIELHDKTKTIELLKKARKKDAVKTKQLLTNAEENLQQQLKTQQQKLDKELEKQMDFAQNLVSDKAALTKRCEELVAEVQKANGAGAREAERFKLKLKDAKERWSVQEKVRRDQWIVKKTEEIKKSTVTALEPDIQLILAKGRADLEKARDSASEERRKLQSQLEKDREMALQRLKDDYERKLVEAREKERAKLMTRLDAADAELQQQLSTQRRRLQEETEVTRNELYAELRSTKLAHAKEMDAMKAQEMQKLQSVAEKQQKEKQELLSKYESEFLALREQTSIECEQFKTQLTSKLREEAAREKQELEKRMLQSRDAKIELVIEKLQDESRQMVERAERKAQKKFDQERAEYERKLQQTGEIEGVWMEKNRELHDKLSKLEHVHDQLRRENEELGQDVRHAGEKASDLAKLLHEERRQHENTVAQLEKRCGSLQTESEYTQQQQSVEITALREKQATLETHFQQQMHKLRDEHETALANLHERVKATIARKDEAIDHLHDELHLLQAKLEKSHALIEEQRLQLFSE